MKSIQATLALCSTLFLLSFVHGGVDETLSPGAKGHVVVETVCSKIQSVCIFPDDKLMLRRIAYVETNDGYDANTYATAYNGGIWKVDEAAFLATKQLTDLSIYASIQSKFNINWSQVVWQDLLKPFYSGLAARLYLHSKTNNIPRPVSNQANLWAAQYRNGGQSSVYVNKVALLSSSCKEIADVAFIVDGSGSIGSTNFVLVKDFLKNVTKFLNIGPDPKLHTRVSVVQFSDYAKLEFNLKTYSTVADYVTRINQIGYMTSGTQTDVALNYLADQSFLASAGARGNDVPKIGIVITDGESNEYSKTLAAANKLHQTTDITVFAIGVGTSLSNSELRAIATDPDCKHLFFLNNFEEFEALIDAIRMKACGAPFYIPSNTSVTVDIYANETKNCQVTVGPSGLTIQITGAGDSTIYFSNDTFPTSAFYELKFDITYNTPAVIYFPGSGVGGEHYVYCRIESSPCKNSTLTFNPSLNYTDPCNPNPCPCDKTCLRRPNFAYECIDSVNQIVTTQTPISKSYDCGPNSPCIPANAALNKFYFTHHDPTKFVQCSQWGQCYIMPCPPGLVWNENLYTCYWNAN